MKAEEIGIFIKTIMPDFEERLKRKISDSDLTEKEKTILNMRLFEDKSLTDCAKELDVSRERIRQLETKAYRKMQHPMFKLNIFDDFDFLQRFETFKKYRAKFYDELFDMEEELRQDEIREENRKTLEDISISECGFTSRAYNCLYRAGIRNLKDLSEYSIRELERVIRGLGKKTTAEIIARVDEIPGFSFKGGNYERFNSKSGTMGKR